MGLLVILDDERLEIRLDGEAVLEDGDPDDLEDELVALVVEGLAEPETAVDFREEGERRRVRLVGLLGPAARREIGWAIADSAPTG